MNRNQTHTLRFSSDVYLIELSITTFSCFEGFLKMWNVALLQAFYVQNTSHPGSGGYDALIMYNNEGEAPFEMGAGIWADSVPQSTLKGVPVNKI